MTIRTFKLISFLFILLTGQLSYGQSETDTALLLKEFNKVMSFTIQPYVYYKSITKLDADPVIQSQDTIHMSGVFYKNLNDLYFGNGLETIYLQDSLMIQINNKRKSIWISKVDVSTKDNMNVLPISNKAFQEIFKKNYAIKKLMVNDSTGRLNFQTIKTPGALNNITSNIDLEFSEKTILPSLMKMQIIMSEVAGDDLLTALKNESVDVKPLIQTIDGVNYFIRKQQATIIFETIDNTKEKAMQMPSWKTVLSFNSQAMDYTGIGKYADYEITKTF